MALNTLLDKLQKSAMDSSLLKLRDKALQSELETIIEKSTIEEKYCSIFHRLLAQLNTARLSIRQQITPQTEAIIQNWCTAMETHWLRHESLEIALYLRQVPSEAEAFVRWFEALEEQGPGQRHPLFLYLAERANRGEFRYFLQQEMATEAGFDDLVAMTQVKAPEKVKTELARNYWDEMGDGCEEELHSVHLRKIIQSFEITSPHGLVGISWAPLALSNLMVALATKRSYFYQSIGALGVIELTSPARCQQVVSGLKRIGLTREEYCYYSLHSVLDREHWEGWKNNVIHPLIQENPQCIREIAEGALLRLFAGEHCYNTYSQHLGLSFVTASSSRVPMRE